MRNLFLFTYTTKQEQKDKQVVYVYFNDDRSCKVHYKKTTKPNVITKSETRAKTKQNKTPSSFFIHKTVETNILPRSSKRLRRNQLGLQEATVYKIYTKEKLNNCI